MSNNKPKILLVYTGGTIGMIKDSKTGALRAFDFKNLSNRIPELNLLDCEIEAISFDEPIDSSNMNPEYWSQIATIIEDNYDQFDGFVVLHGSDTMSYTASALSFMLKGIAKPVDLTGSQLPIGVIRTDGKENLITALDVAPEKQEPQKVEAKDVQALIASEQNFFPSSNAGMVITVLTTFSGYSAVGVAAVADHSNINVPQLKRRARRDAFSQLREHEGYVLCEKLRPFRNSYVGSREKK